MSMKHTTHPVNETISDNSSDNWTKISIDGEESLVRPATMHKDLIEAIAGRNGEKTQLVSIRMSESLIEDLKCIGKKKNLGYQTLAKNVLKRFVDAELRKELNEIRALKRKVAELEAKVEKQDRKQKLA